ncbi:Nucleobase-ascorbate transporter 11 [Datura stramonium]|uniref:Nucleobase-ascorbate transporter 11 n=1 Tax=Datura stramonium TaxID=4076 RepID=A0ABS8T9U6_DATST|nr:Nucleobase-ascorbate transporter 11 [Datura stramonium]
MIPKVLLVPARVASWLSRRSPKWGVSDSKSPACFVGLASRLVRLTPPVWFAGSSFVYLAPALVIMNSEEYRNLAEHKFRYIMRELQGAIIVGSIFQSFLGYSGLRPFFYGS